jgi:hypothetical protein
MKDLSPASTEDTADHPSNRSRKDRHASQTWLDNLEPFAIDWELIWPM